MECGQQSSDHEKGAFNMAVSDSNTVHSSHEKGVFNIPKNDSNTIHGDHENGVFNRNKVENVISSDHENSVFNNPDRMSLMDYKQITVMDLSI